MNSFPLLLIYDLATKARFAVFIERTTNLRLWHATKGWGKIRLLKHGNSIDSLPNTSLWSMAKGSSKLPFLQWQSGCMKPWKITADAENTEQTQTQKILYLIQVNTYHQLIHVIIKSRSFLGGCAYQCVNWSWNILNYYFSYLAPTTFSLGTFFLHASAKPMRIALL